MGFILQILTRIADENFVWQIFDKGYYKISVPKMGFISMLKQSQSICDVLYTLQTIGYSVLRFIHLKIKNIQLRIHKDNSILYFAQILQLIQGMDIQCNNQQRYYPLSSLHHQSPRSPSPTNMSHQLFVSTKNKSTKQVLNLQTNAINELNFFVHPFQLGI